MDDNVQEFINDGVTVFENIFTDEEIEKIRDSFHEQLQDYGINHTDILNKAVKPPNNIRIKGAPSRIFYKKWKIDVSFNEKVYNCMKILMEKTFASGEQKYFEHDMGKFDDLYGYIDRVCYRLPDDIKEEGGLLLHIDRNPFDPELKKYGGMTKWRPIQAFIALTDQFGSESGGLRVVKGFHKEIDEYFKNNNENISGGGEFFRLISKSHTKLEKRCQPVNAPKGSLVCWDNRLPHATAQKCAGNDTREVVYVGYLPSIDINRIYVQQQLSHLRKNIPPPAYYEKDETSDKDWNEKDLTNIQKKLLGVV